ncbi:hypothetical protein GOP47_0025356 [Adiantum capillus-veneris]|uniref:Uncharacterized protein n=1 Tax=Adiantum capillus-veneris TaxID=13818 RepID=A0A9D4U0V0_ADICA|nr:hypothetical protein GOP47_0025356 [Adiantum capillus-veneris]
MLKKKCLDRDSSVTNNSTVRKLCASHDQEDIVWHVVRYALGKGWHDDHGSPYSVLENNGGHGVLLYESHDIMNGAAENYVLGHGNRQTHVVVHNKTEATSENDSHNMEFERTRTPVTCILGDVRRTRKACGSMMHRIDPPTLGKVRLPSLQDPPEALRALLSADDQ